MNVIREPDAWRWRYTDEQSWTVQKHKPRWYKPFMTDVVIESLYTAERMERLDRAARAVEEWWTTDGMNHFDGAPAAIFALREALK